MTRRYHASMTEGNDNLINFIAATVESLSQRMDTISDQMATKVDLAAVKNDLTAVRDKMATKDDLGRLETTMRGEFEQVHIRLDSMDRRVDTRMGQIETDVSRLRSFTNR